jgi:2,4-dienoyl-CoA reductase-like NADH-dependent reductase (Old Yellow Enzyme family)
MPPKTNTPSDVDAARSAAILGKPLTLPCGVTLPNRLVKAAMSELLADTRNRATAAHQNALPRLGQGWPGLDADR